MNMRLGPKKAVRRRRRPKKTTGRRYARRGQHRRFLKEIVGIYIHRKPPTEMTVVFRLINILGLALLVLVLSILGSNDNFFEIVKLGKELFQALP